DKDSTVTETGIYIQYQDSVEITGNEVFNITDSSGHALYGINATENIKAIISSNLIHDIILAASFSQYQVTGVYLYYSSPSNGYANTLLSNNMIYHVAGNPGGSASTAERPSGMMIHYNFLPVTDDIQIYHNSIFLTPNDTSSLNANGDYSAGVIALGLGTSLDFRNNIIRNSLGKKNGTSATNTIGYAVYCSTGNPFSTINNNLYYVSNHDNNYIGYANSSNSATLSNWQSNISGDNNSHNQDPLFVSETDLHIQSGQAITGEEITGVTEDIDGTPRLKYHIGAHEDIEVSSIEADTITSDTTWSGDLVQINGDIHINSTATLTIDPGTRVEFKGSYNITVYGTIIATGTEQDSIFFTTNDTTGFDALTYQGWGITFDSTSAVNDSSFFKYCHFEYGGGDSDSCGGAIYIDYFDKVEISNCLFIYNGSTLGGALCTQDANIKIKNSIFSNNYATTGGSIAQSYGRLYILNNLICNNQSNKGGGISVENDDSSMVINNSIVNNTADAWGGGIRMDNNSNAQFYNNIIYGNNAGSDGPQVMIGLPVTSPSFYFNNIEGGQAAFGGMGSVDEYTNNIDSLPSFLNPSPTYSNQYPGYKFDWRLNNNSPCINAGKPSFTTDSIGVSLDLAGKPRIFGDTVDIGAYENRSFTVSEFTINDTVVWDADTVFISDTLYITSTGYLTIESGVVIAVDDDAAIITEGRLEVNGTAGNEVEFINNGTTGWNGIVINTTDPNSNLSYTSIDAGPTSAAPAIKVIDSDFEISNCQVIRSYNPISCDSSNISIDNCSFIFSDSKIKDQLIFNNCDSVYFTNTSFTIDSMFSSDMINIDSSSVTFDNCTFINKESTYSNYLANITNNSDDTVYFNDGYFEGTTYIYTGFSTDGVLYINRNQFFDTKSIGYFSGGTVYVTNNEMFYSESTSINNYQFNVNSTTIVRYYNNTAFCKTNSQTQAFFSIGGGFPVDIKNSIIWNFPNPTYEDGGSLILEYCNIENNTFFGGTNMMELYPKFADTTGSNFNEIDLSLLSSSPCINAGKPDFTVDSVYSDVDLADSARIYGGRIDIGAYEFQGEPTVLYVSDTIDANTTWNADTVYIIDTLWIGSGATLSIDPGVVVIIYDNTTAGNDVPLIIDGELQVNGLEGDSVQFIPLSTEAWDGINFMPGASQNSVINYAIFKMGYGNPSNEGTIYANKVSIEVNNSSFYGGVEASSEHIRLDSTNSLIENCYFDLSESKGIKVENGDSSIITLSEFLIPSGNAGATGLSIENSTTLVDSCSFIDENLGFENAVHINISSGDTVWVVNSYLEGMSDYFQNNDGVVYFENNLFKDPYRVAYLSMGSGENYIINNEIYYSSSNTVSEAPIFTGDVPVKMYIYNNSVFAHNSSVYFIQQDYGTIDVKNNIVWGFDEFIYEYSGSKTSEYNCTEDLTETGTGNIHIYPEFVDTTDLNYDLSLIDNSVCINLGDPSFNKDNLGTDIDLAGNSRFVDRIDMGAYEFQGPFMDPPGNALAFNGIDQYTSVPYDTILNPDEFTIECWVKTDSFSADFESIISTAAASGGHGYQLIKGYDSTWNFALGNGITWKNVISNNKFFTGQWYHLAGTYNGSYATFYVNGHEQDTINLTFSKNTTSPLILAKHGNNMLYYFDGQLDEMRLWNSALSANAIHENSHKALNGDESGLIAYYDFDRMADSILPNVSAYRLDGRLKLMDDTSWVESDALIIPFTDTATNITLNSFTANWDSIPDALYYILDVSADFNFVNDKIVDSANVGNVFAYEVTGLIPDSTYYYRVMAVLAEDTSEWSVAMEVKTDTIFDGTDIICGVDSIQDIDGNWYQTVPIGGQCWMKENLAATKSNDGSAIPKVENGTDWTNLSNTDKAYCWYDNDSISNAETYGAIYTWAAIMNDEASSSANPSGVQGICPDGWHIPSDEEWKQLEMYLGMGQSDANQIDVWRGTNEGDELKATDGWIGGGNGSNESGFTALPGGLRNGGDGNFLYKGTNGYWWTSTEFSSIFPWRRILEYDESKIGRFKNVVKFYGHSVRCISDSIVHFSELTVSNDTLDFGSQLTDILEDTLTFWIYNKGNDTLYFDSISIIDAPFYDNFMTPYVLAGDSTLFEVILDLDTVGVFETELRFFTDSFMDTTTIAVFAIVQPQPANDIICGVDSIQDMDGNWYQTVPIGGQCWIQKNLKTTRYADGSLIPKIDNDTDWANLSVTDKAYSWENDDSITYSDYGALYSWAAAMNGSASSDSVPSGIQGVCPDGWHIPGDEEWKVLEMFLGMNRTNADMGETIDRGTNEGSKLAGNASLWSNGNLENNTKFGETGFDALPIGYRGNGTGSFGGIGDGGDWWSSTEFDNDNAWFREIYFENSEIGRFYYYGKDAGLSVRCLADSIVNFSQLTISEDTLDFGIQPSFPVEDTLSFWIYNNGNDTLFIDSVSTLNAPFSHAFATAFILAGDSVLFEVILDLSTFGIYSDMLYLFTSDKTDSVFITAEIELLPPGYALDFDGIDDHAIAPNDDICDPSGDFTVEVWAKIGDPIYASGLILDKRYINGSHKIGYAIYYDDNANKIRATIGSNYDWIYVSTPEIEVNSWYHIALSYNSADSIAKIYQNGKLVDSVFAPDGYNLVTNYAALQIAQSVFGTTSSFVGRVDEVRFWNVLRTNEEIKANYNDTISKSSPNLETYYDFNQGSGSSLIDATGNGNNLTINSMHDTDWVSSSALIYPAVSVSPNINIDNFSLYWDPIPGADYYLVDVATDSNFTNFVGAHQNEVVNDTTISITGLTDGPQYFYRIKTVMLSGKESEYYTSSIGLVPGEALAFDGIDDYVVVSDGAIGEPDGDFTVETWVKVEEPTNSSSSVIDKRYTNAQQKSGYSIAYSNISHKLVGNMGSYDEWTTVSTPEIELNNWYHIAIAYRASDSTFSLYQNGMLVDQSHANYGYNDDNNQNDLYFGGSPFSNLEFKGEIDEIRIWNVERSQVEIFEFMDQKIDPTTPELEAYYDFERISDEHLPDITNNYNDGVLTNMGASSWIPSSAIITPMVHPITNITTNSFELNWNSVPVVDYFVLDVATDSNFTNFVGIHQDEIVNDTTIEISGLTNGTLYFYRIKSVMISGKESDYFASSVTLIPGEALTFNGVDEYVVIPDDAIGDPTGDLTVETWVKIKESVNPYGGIVEKRYINGSHKIGYVIEYIEATGSIAAGIGSYYDWISISTPELLMDTWYHIALSYNSSDDTVKVYLNGNLVSTNYASNSYNSLNNPNDLNIGRSPLYTGSLFKGEIDEVRIWDTERTQEEINEYMHNRVNQFTPGLVAYYDFERISDQLLPDVTRNGNDGTLTNMDASNWVPSSAIVIPTVNSPSDITTTSFTANWDSIPGATEYWLDVSTDSTFAITDVLDSVSTGTDHFYSVTGLDPNTTYYYRVNSYTSILSDWSDIMEVTTGGIAIIDISLNSIDFGTQIESIGNDTLDFWIYNSGDGTLLIDSIGGIEPPFDDNFGTTAEILPGDSLLFEVILNLDTLGIFEDTLWLFSNDKDTSVILQAEIIPANNPPVAFNDSAETCVEVPVIIDVLANDTDADGDNLQSLVISLPANGTAIVLNNDSIQYVPDLGFSGIDTVVYEITDVTDYDTAIVIITVNPLPDISITNDTAICEGDGITLTVSGGINYQWSTSETTADITVSPMVDSVYYVLVTDANGCMNMDSVQVFVNTIDSTYFYGEICEGDNFMGYDSTGIYYENYFNRYGCDSVVEIEVVVNSVDSTYFYGEICEGGDFMGYDSAGIYYENYTNMYGCDSVVEIEVVVNAGDSTYFYGEICEGGDFMGYDSAGIYFENYTNMYGCDSVVEIEVIVNPGDSTYFYGEICEGDNFMGYDSAGIYFENYTNIYGCDSVVEIEVIVHIPDTTYNYAEICQGADYLGYTETGIYYESFTNQYGCDSVLEIEVVVTDTITIDNYIEICEADDYTLPGGGIVSVSGTYIDSLISVNGCDSIVTTYLTVNLPDSTYFYGEICQGGDFMGYDSAGIYFKNYTNMYGCDSVVEIEVVVNPSDSTYFFGEICEGSSFMGYDSVGIYFENYTNQFGCDSIVEIEVVVNSGDSTYFYTEICEGDNFMGYDSAGIYYENYLNIYGCDSVIEIEVVVNYPDSSYFYGEICLGDNFMGYDSTGIYFENYSNQYGCDSIVEIEVYVHPVDTTYFYGEICLGSSFMGYDSSGIYFETYTDRFGCDSILEIEVVETAEIHTFESITICEGESFNGFFESGSYYDSLLSISGCDSIHELNLTVLPKTIITDQPSNASVLTGETTQFEVIAEGSNLTYQWQRRISGSWHNLIDTLKYSGSNTNTLEIADIAFENAGNYRCIIVGDCGSIGSTFVTLHVSASEVSQNINLSEGWNIISLSLNPFESNLQNLLQPLIDGDVLIKVQDEKGSAIEKVGETWFNFIGDVLRTEGYLVKVNMDTVIEINGGPIREATRILLSSGWNIISYPDTISEYVASVFDELILDGYLEKIQDEKGASFEEIIPLGWIDNIGDLIPGEGYKVRVNAPSILFIGEQELKSTSLAEPEQSRSHFKPAFEGNGLDHMNIYIENVLVNSMGIQAGDEIAVFDGNICAGVHTFSQYTNGYIPIAVSKDDPVTEEIDGYTAGSNIRFKLWLSKEEKQLNVVLIEYLDGSPEVFVPQGKTIVRLSAEYEATGIEPVTAKITKLGENYPNPFKKETIISYSLAEKDKVILVVYNILGEKVKILVNEEMPAGEYTITWKRLNENGAKVPPGIYFYH
ncbi:LamG-like jellyroll fold domain-containing protein, partial [Bacteroidota bacterium]